MHIGGNFDAGEAAVVPTIIYHKLGNYAHCFRCAVEKSIAYGAHNSGAAGSVDASPLSLSKCFAEAVGGFDICLGYIVARCAIDAYIAVFALHNVTSYVVFDCKVTNNYFKQAAAT